ncbi:hypothetical protein KBC04_03730 [Candidatus Babeliales bacterium]|nr:hypothetical protein [Candidatus Babeliales bacterium]MBP9844178.1 hypothetical protein [Candidatus Babeliales bacterium]
MIVKNNWLRYGALLLCLPSFLFADLTTLQSWDPVPFFNAANLNMPPDTQFCYGIKEIILDEATDKRRHIGINISPFVQRAIRAQQSENVFFGVSGSTDLGGVVTAAGGAYTPQMSDYQGTAFLMGLFMGQDINGNSIWGGPSAVDTGLTTDITTATVAALTEMPSNLRDAINALNDNAHATSGSTPTPGPNAVIYNIPSNSAGTAPSILSESVLEADNIYFGAFSTPLTYQKTGFRWELNLDISDNVGFLVRGGLCQIVQRVIPPTPLAGLAPSQMSNYTQNGTQNTGAMPSLYTGLNTVENGATDAAIPAAIAQSVFNQWVSNNLEDLFDPINGINQNYETFTLTGVEDMQFLAFLRHAFPIHPNDPEKYASVIATPYANIGATLPLAAVQDYSKLYGLPLGNNSHVSVGGVVGLTLDFIDSIEFGFEFGATYFLKKTIYGVPCPNHILQRVIYPYRQDLIVSPGFNGQFAFIFNAYEFAHNTSFSFRYNYVQHNQDTITLVTPSPYFLPSQLEIISPWTSQMFIAAFTFEIQPAIFLSIAWQGALAQRNAYCSNTILGSLNFQF